MTLSLTYIVQSVPWALVGLLAGFFLGRSIVAVEAVTDAGPDEEATVPTPPRRRPRISGNTVIAAVLIVFGLLGAAQAYTQSNATDRIVGCLRDYGNQVADALDARGTATTEAQQALDDLLGQVSSATPTAEGRDLVRRALAEYLSKRAAAKTAQAEHPYPPAPRDVCKEAR